MLPGTRRPRRHEGGTRGLAIAYEMLLLNTHAAGRRDSDYAAERFFRRPLVTPTSLGELGD